MADPRRCINLGCGRRPAASTNAQNWWNVDILALPGVDQQVDLFRVPWPWGNGGVDHFLARNFLEHIPHGIAVYPLSAFPVGSCPVDRAWLDRLAALPDGFFAFFAEVWRCLAPGGTITCEVPWPLSFEAISDPTHTRFITPQTIPYLTNPETWIDYDLPFRFAAEEGFLFGVDPRYTGDDPATFVRAREQWGVVHTWEFTLRKLENGDGGTE